MWAEEAGCNEIDPPTEKIREFGLEGDESKTDGDSWLEFDEDVEIALSLQLAPDRRPKHSESVNAVAAAETAESRPIEREGKRTFHKMMLAPAPAFRPSPVASRHFHREVPCLEVHESTAGFCRRAPSSAYHASRWISGCDYANDTGCGGANDASRDRRRTSGAFETPFVPRANNAILGLSGTPAGNVTVASGFAVGTAVLVIDVTGSWR